MGDSLSRTLNWAFSIFTGEDNTLSNLSGMGVPSLGVDTLLFGYGVVKLAAGGNASGSDMGYIQVYYLMGMSMALMFYSILAFYLFRYWHNAGRNSLLALLILPLFLVEMKEPFIFKYMYCFFIFTVLHCLYLPDRQIIKYSN